MVDEILRPKVLVLPTGQGGNTGVSGMEPGTIFLSGAKLYFAKTAGVLELITSA